MSIVWPQIFHDPQARLDYRWEWGEPDSWGRTWLGGDTITDAVVTSPDPSIEIEDVSHDDTSVVAWVSGGTVGTSVKLTCHITTAAGRQDDRTINLAIRQR